MAYGADWNPSRYNFDADKVREQAERQAGGAPLGVLYRFDDVSYASSNEDGDYSTSSEHVELTAYPIHKLTFKGWTLESYSGSRRRWVSGFTSKRFALPTVEEAMKSFIKRKTRQAQIYESRAKRARRMIELAEGKTWHSPSVHMEIPA